MGARADLRAGGYPLLKPDGMLSSNFVVQYSTNLAIG
jgi:hypothetical protein